MTSSHEAKASKKRSAEEAELEIDLNAPEPPSKKALRKAKKAATNLTDVKDRQAANSKDIDRARPDAHESERSNYGVWIGNLSFSTTKKDLRQFLLDASISENEITRIHLPPGDGKHNQNKGFAYIDFTGQASVDKAVLLSEALLAGRRLLIKDAKNFEGRPDRAKDQKAKSFTASSRKVFIGNLDFDTTEKDLEKHFSVCGHITKIKIASFQDSGKCKGYAWIEFETIAAAETAMRGWVEVDKSEALRSNDQKVPGKRIWLQQIGQRKLRMEFAEDPSFRYKKRFGNLRGQRDPLASTEQIVSEVARTPITDRPDATQHSENSDRKRQSRLQNQEHRKQISNTRYDGATVRKLTGAIVEGAGTKVIFE